MSRLFVALIIFMSISLIGYLTAEPDPKGLAIGIRVFVGSVAGYLLGWALIMKTVLGNGYRLSTLFLTVFFFNLLFLFWYLAASEYSVSLLVSSTVIGQIVIIFKSIKERKAFA